MTRIIFELSELDYLAFSQKVGRGNMSSVLRDYIKTLINSQGRDEKETNLRKKLQETEKAKKEIEQEYAKLDRKLKAIEAKNATEQKAKEEELRKQKEHAKSIERATVKTHAEEMIFRGKK